MLFSRREISIRIVVSKNVFEIFSSFFFFSFFLPHFFFLFLLLGFFFSSFFCVSKACVCSAAKRDLCLGQNGKFDVDSCSCACQEPKGEKFMLTPGSKFPSCTAQCKPDAQCKGTLSEESCLCSCTNAQNDKCEGKGLPAAPSCEICGTCLEVVECGAGEMFDTEECSCRCLDAVALQCPAGNNGVDKLQCLCKCPPTKEAFMQVVDPSSSCDPTCKSMPSCAEKSSVTKATLQTKCQVRCYIP